MSREQTEVFAPHLLQALRDARRLAKELNTTVDVRLQLYEGKWRLWTGDIQFDTDHRGAWSSAEIQPNDSLADLLDVCHTLIMEAQEAEMEMTDEE
jgi:hypothetical protein